MRAAACCALTTALTTALLAACGTDGPLRLPPSAAGLISGTGLVTPSALPTSAAAALAGSASVQIGRKQVEVATVELDPSCSRLVTPFEPSDNVSELLALGATMAGQSASDSASEYLRNLGKSTPVMGRAAADLKRGLPMSLRRAALRMNWLPMSLEQMYGRRTLDELQTGNRLMPREGRYGVAQYRIADAMFAQVLAGVKEPHPYKFELFISTDSSQNAKAYAGGYVVIDDALIKQPELHDKAYFALAHEVAHVLQRHETRALQARVIDSLALSAGLPELIKTIHQAHSEPAAVLRLVMGGKLMFEKHAESQELQSDSCAVRLLDLGLANDQRLLAAVQGFVKSLPKQVVAPAQAKPNAIEEVTKLADLVSRPVDAHPTTEARVKNLGTMLAKLRERPVNGNPTVKPGALSSKPALKPVPLPTLIKPKSGG